MRIGIDIRCLADGRRSGVEEYTLNLLENIFALDGKNEYFLFFNSFSQPKTDFSWLEKYPNVKLRKFRFPNKLLNFCLWFFSWPKLDVLLGGTDIFFLPNINFYAVSSSCELVLTVHDLTFEVFPETFSWKRRWWHIFVNPRRIAREARKIIAVSESTRNDLVEIYGLEKRKIKTIHSGVNRCLADAKKNVREINVSGKQYKLPEKFFLCFGTIEPRKNIQGATRAFNIFQQYAASEKNIHFSEHFLIIAGYSGWAAEKIFEEIEKSPFREKIIIIQDISQDDKELLYSKATIFLLPSFYEGFGFPVLEAMSCGAPVIASNNSSLPEIVSEKAIMIDPDKPLEIFLAMKEILNSPELAEKMKVEGKRRSLQFDWKKTAEKTLEFILE